MTRIVEIAVSDWTDSLSYELQQNTLKSLEMGDVVLFPSLSFELQGSEKKLLTPDILEKNRKNISYDPHSEEIKGIKTNFADEKALSQTMMSRFYQGVKNLISELLPSYQNYIYYGRTSFRPAQIASRKPLSKHKDDRLIHVDAFPASPIGDKRILRVFTNINPADQPRRWRLGKSFTEVIDRYLENISRPTPGVRKLKKWLGFTRSYQTLYDYYMLKLHHQMKTDEIYQQQYPEIYEFHANSTWMVYTDIVPHAAMAGQFVLEQTIYVPVEAMQKPELSPLKILEQQLNQSLLI